MDLASGDSKGRQMHILTDLVTHWCTHILRLTHMYAKWQIDTEMHTD